jgi:hypothetical protein
VSATVSVMCMCCNWRISLTGEAGPALDAELDKMREERGWIVLPPRNDPRRSHPVDVCSACAGEIRELAS